MNRIRLQSIIRKSPVAVAIVAMASVTIGCGQLEGGTTPLPEQEGPVTLEVITREPVTATDGQTRVTLSEDNLVWEGDETLGVLFSSTQDTAGGPRAILKSVSAGRFAGKIDLSEFNFQGRT